MGEHKKLKGHNYDQWNQIIQTGDMGRFQPD